MANAGLKVVITAVDKASKTLNQVGDNFAKTGGALGSVSKGAAVAGAGILAGGAALGALGAKAVSAAGDFEQSMNILQSTTGESSQGMERLSGLAKQMGADTVFSSKEAADAMVELAKGGITSAQIEGGALQATLNLAATEGLALADAAVIASNTMNTFGLEAKDSSVIADALAGASNASSASVASLSQALAQVGPGATNAGLSLQDTVGALAAFDAAGIKGSDAGTSLKTMLTRLVPTTDGASVAMESLGLKFTDAEGSFLPLTEIAGQLQEKLGGLSEEAKTAALGEIFGSDATRAATVLMKEGSEGLAKYISAANETGTAQKMAEARTKGFNGAMEALGGSIETLQITAGEYLLPVITQIVRAFTGIVNVVSTAVPKIKSAFSMLFDSSDPEAIYGFAEVMDNVFGNSGRYIEFFTGLGSRIRDVASFLTTTLIPAVQSFGLFLMNTVVPAAAAFGGWLTKYQAWLLPIAAAVVAVVAALKVYAAVMLVVTKAKAAWAAVTAALAAKQMALNAALVANPLGLVVLAIVALVAAFVVAYKRSETFRNIVDGALKAVGTAFTWLKDKAAAAFKWIKEKGFDFIVTVIKNSPLGLTIRGVYAAFKWFRDNASGAIKWVGDKWDAFVEFLAGLPTALGNFGATVVNVLTWPFRTAFNAIADLWNNTVGRLSFTVPDWVPGIGGRGFSMPTLPTIPALAVGGRINADGLAYLHKGERVMPADVTYGPRGYAGGPTVVVNVGTTLATKREIAEAVTDALKASGARGLRLA